MVPTLVRARLAPRLPLPPPLPRKRKRLSPLLQDLEHYSDLGVLQLYADTITRPGYVVVALVVGFTGALLGRVAAVRFVKTAAHPSVLIFMLGATLLLSAALLVGRVAQREGQNVRVRSHDLNCMY